RLEADNAPPATAVTEFGFDRSATGTYETVRLPGEREQRVGLRPGGPDDAIVFVTAVHDWVRDLSTAGVYGTRQLRLRLLDAAGNELVPAKKETLTLDDTAPAGVKFVALPRTAVRGKALPVAATGGDAESGIRQVLFFLGD